MPDENIEYIDKNTRRRNGKLEKKDPITGVWVIHPIQFYKDNQREMEQMWDEIDRDNRREQDRMFEPKNAEEFLHEAVSQYEEDAKYAKVKKVLDVSLSGGFKENNVEIIFDGSLRDKHSRYIAGCVSYSGDFYEPPSEECWFDDFYDLLNYQEKTVKKSITPKRVFTGRKIQNKYGVMVNEELPLNKASKEQIENERRRLERIYYKDMERLDYLKKFKD
jgi:hypothetical protein